MFGFGVQLVQFWDDGIPYTCCYSHVRRVCFHNVFKVLCFVGLQASGFEGVGLWLDVSGMLVSEDGVCEPVIFKSLRMQQGTCLRRFFFVILVETVTNPLSIILSDDHDDGCC